MDHFLAGNPTILFFMLTTDSTWNAYGIVPSICSPWTGPYGFHGSSSDFILHIHVLFHMDSMEESTSNSMENPLNGLSKIVPMLEIKHSTLSVCDVHKQKDILTAGLYDH